MELDLENPLPTTAVQSLFIIESDQNPSPITDLNPHLRREIVSVISILSRNLGYSVSYLAINYLDRFLFSHNIPKGNQWAMRLMAISCVSLALKMMRKTECHASDFQHGGSHVRLVKIVATHEEGFIFDPQTICRMEKLILGALKWRMRSITPFSFINFFIVSFKLKDPPLSHALKARATEIILQAQNEAKMLEFKPSLISATALLCASHELFPLQYSCFKEAISTCEYVNKNEMYKCYKKMQEMAMDGYESVLGGAISSTNTPVNVLDLHYHSTTTTTITSLISSDNKQDSEKEEEEATTKLEPETKRRKVRPSEPATAALG